MSRGGLTYLAVHDAVTSALGDAAVGPATIGDTAYPDWGFHVVEFAILERHPSVRDARIAGA